MPTKALARIMYEENQLRFKDVEHARKVLRYIEGKNGDKSRRNMTKDEHFMAEERTRTPYKGPEPESDDLIPYELTWNDFILAADFHIPNHRIDPIQCMLDYAKEHGIRKLFINGDLLDNTPFTKWTREPVSGQDVKRWFDQAIAFLEEMKTHFDEIMWLEGNHDFWYTRWLMSKVELLFGDPYYSLEKRLDLDRIGVKFLNQNTLVRAGKLYISHGHVLVKSGGVHAAHKVVTKSQASHIISHLHREQSFTITAIDGSIHTGYVTGCMCSLGMDYQPYGGGSCHGFAHISVKPNRDFKVRNYRVFNGEVL